MRRIIGWPPKSSDKTTNANKQGKVIHGVDFAAELELANVA